MRDEILKFSNIDITDYINQKHKTDDEFLIKNQIHNLKKYLKEINEELYKAFIINSDSLLAILNDYQYCTAMVKQLDIPKVDHQISDEININYEQCKELSKAFLYFKDEMDPFLINERYLIISEYFNSKKYYVVITNDITFIGEKEEGSRKYILNNTFNNKLIEVSVEDSEDGEKVLIFKVQHIIYNFISSSDISLLYNLIDIYDEINYSYYYNSENYNEGKETKGIDNNLMRYYVITEQFDKLSEYLEGFGKVDLSLEYINIQSYSQLISLLKVSKKPEAVVFNYVLLRFKEGLNQIDKIQELGILISDTFGYLKCFVNSLEKLYAKIEGLEEYSLTLAIEKFIMMIFESLEKRIFNKFNKIRVAKENLDLIEKNLVFNGYNFGYMMDCLTQKKGRFSKRCLNLAKNQISELITKYLQ